MSIAPIQPANFAMPTIIGRSSSHFTRIARIFAAELAVDYSFTVVRDLSSFESQSYGGNPALKLPILETSTGTWFGALNICRELSRHSKLKLRILWPEALDRALLANAQELVLQAMATEVTLIMSKLASNVSDSAHQAKLRKSLLNTMSWLDAHLLEILATQPSNQDLSYLETTLFCLTTHLEFRNVMPIACYANLIEFCRRFETRSSARDTPYFLDA